MQLPNYFLADLPSEATLSAAMITQACQTLKRNRETYLAERSTASLVRLLSVTAENWLQPDYPFRKLALEQGPEQTGFSTPTLAAGLDSFFSELTEENLRALLAQELGHPQRLDAVVASPEEQQTERGAIATGPELLVHIAGGQLPNPVFLSIILGLLVRSAQFVKCATGASLLPRLFAHSLYDAEPKLGACLEVAAWRGGDESLDPALFAEADCVTATGSDETLGTVRKRLPQKVRFLGYGHRVSFGYITKEALDAFGAKPLAQRAAADVAAWDQLGCLSPHVIYVEKGGHVPGMSFAELLAQELERIEPRQPRGPLSPAEAAAISNRRAIYEVRAAHLPDTRHWCSAESTAWTVVFEGDPRFQLSCLNRFIYVKETADLANALESADAVRGQVSTVGLAATTTQTEPMVRQLARWGVPRVCPLGQMQKPPLTWRHDGRPTLGDLVTWTDWERG